MLVSLYEFGKGAVIAPLGGRRKAAGRKLLAFQMVLQALAAKSMARTAAIGAVAEICILFLVGASRWVWHGVWSFSLQY
jgi:hypothetical protein